MPVERRGVFILIIAGKAVLLSTGSICVHEGYAARAENLGDGRVSRLVIYELCGGGDCLTAR